LHRRLPHLVIGRVLGAPALGLFTVAQRVTETLITDVFPRLTLVLFPACAQIGGDPDRLGRSLLATLRLANVTVPAAVGVALVAEPLVAIAASLVLAVAGVLGSSAALALAAVTGGGLEWLIGGLVAAAVAQALLDLAVSTRLLEVQWAVSFARWPRPRSRPGR
jgi:PST family polysaccharide transporter